MEALNSLDRDINKCDLCVGDYSPDEMVVLHINWDGDTLILNGGYLEDCYDFFVEVSTYGEFLGYLKSDHVEIVSYSPALKIGEIEERVYASMTIREVVEYIGELWSKNGAK